MQSPRRLQKYFIKHEQYHILFIISFNFDTCVTKAVNESARRLAKVDRMSVGTG